MNDHQYTDQEICCIIRDYDQMIQDIRHRIESLARELWDLDSNDDWLCKLLSLQHQETGTITTHTDHHDLSDLLKSKKVTSSPAYRGGGFLSQKRTVGSRSMRL